MLDSDGTLLNFSYPSDDEPDQFISRVGITFPGGFELVAWEKQAHATFDGPKCPHTELAGIVDDLFTKLLKVRFHYVVQGLIRN